MKRVLGIFAIFALLSSCGGGETAKESNAAESNTMSANEESAAAEEIIKEVQTDVRELEQNTEESLQEVDSLLENF